MSNRHPIKEKVILLNITKPSQKIRFQLRHPETVNSIIGIAVTSNLSYLITPKTNYGNTAGVLTIAIAQQGDVSYCEAVSVDNNDYLDFTEKIIYNNNTKLEINIVGKQLTYFETHFPIKEAISEGYYEDVFLKDPLLIEEFISKGDVFYQVRIYIRYDNSETT
jgi:hypothetical protein